MSLLNEVGARLMEARKNAKLTRVQMSQRHNIAEATLYDIEHGLNPIGVVRLNKLCTIYGVTPQWAMTGVNDEAETPEFKAAIAKIKEGGQAFMEAAALLQQV